MPKTHRPERSPAGFPHPRTPLSALHEEIVACSRCPRLRAHCETVALVRKREFRDQSYWGRPVPGFGDPAACLLVVGLAPAAHGANRTGRMFTGDSSGDWLYEALHRYGWASRPDSRSRDDGMVLTGCYITAAARCAPPDNRPTGEELERCRPWLEGELALLRDVRVVLTLGWIGWKSWLRASGWWERLGPAGRPTFGHGGLTRLPDGMLLLSSFHPSRQNTNTGKLTRAMWHGVFERARGLVGGGEGGKGKGGGRLEEGEWEGESLGEGCHPERSEGAALGVGHRPAAPSLRSG